MLNPPENRNVLLVAATLIAIVTFQAVVNVPGGVWHQRNGDVVEWARFSSQSVPFHIFLFFNTLAFSSSVLLILCLTFGYPFFFEVLVATISMIVIYGSAIFDVITLHPSYYLLLAAAGPFIIQLSISLISSIIHRTIQEIADWGSFTQTIIQQQQANASQQGQVQSGTTEMGRMVVFEEFKKHHPLAFRGDPDPLVAEAWLKQVTKMMDVMGVVEDLRVSLASYLFEEEADRWWDTVKRRYDVGTMTWTRFEELFMNNYFREAAKLSHFAPRMVEDEIMKTRRFIMGLRPYIRGRLVPFRLTVYSEVVERAMLIEQESKKQQKTQQHKDQGGSNQNRRGSNNNNKSQQQQQRNMPYQRPSSQEVMRVVSRCVLDVAEWATSGGIVCLCSHRGISLVRGNSSNSLRGDINTILKLDTTTTSRFLPSSRSLISRGHHNSKEDEIMKTMRFIMGLRLSIRVRLVPFRLTKDSETVERAMPIEQELEEHQKAQVRKDHGGSNQSRCGNNNNSNNKYQQQQQQHQQQWNTPSHRPSSLSKCVLDVVEWATSGDIVRLCSHRGISLVRGHSSNPLNRDVSNRLRFNTTTTTTTTTTTNVSSSNNSVPPSNNSLVISCGLISRGYHNRREGGIRTRELRV